MRAAITDSYGDADVLSIAEIDRPEPGDDEILVKVFAAPVTFGAVIAAKTPFHNTPMTAT